MLKFALSSYFCHIAVYLQSVNKNINNSVNTKSAPTIEYCATAAATASGMLPSGVEAFYLVVFCIMLPFQSNQKKVAVY